MDVTATNFDAAAELLESLLPTCSFYAIDEEMTGIMLSKETAPSMADVCEQRYAKMKRVVCQRSSNPALAEPGQVVLCYLRVLTLGRCASSR